jgi:hypothetical protein
MDSRDDLRNGPHKILKYRDMGLSGFLGSSSLLKKTLAIARV